MTNSLRSAASTLATFVGLRRPVRYARPSDSRVMDAIVAEIAEQSRRQAEHDAALAAAPALAAACRAEVYAVLTTRAHAGDEFARMALAFHAA